MRGVALALVAAGAQRLLGRDVAALDPGDTFPGKVPPAFSLGVTFAILGAGIAWSMWKTRKLPVPAAATETSRELSA